MNTRQDGRPTGGLDSFFDTLRRPGIVRVSEGRWFGGVATGLARRTGVDPLVVRAGFVVAAIIFGVGIALYLALWLLLPSEDGSLAIERALRHGEGGSIFLLVVTVLSLANVFGPPWADRPGALEVLGVAGMGAFLVWLFTTRPTSGEPARPGPVGDGVGVDRTPPGEATDQPAVAYAATASTGPLPHAPAPPAPPVPYAPRVRVTTPVIGFALGLVLLGTAFLAGALTTMAADAGNWPGNHVAVGVAVALGVLGTGILVAGITGRRAGWVVPFAVVGMLVTLVASTTPVDLRAPWSAGEQRVQPTSLAAAGPYELGMGELRVDLTGAQLDADPQTVETVEASVGMGEIQLVIPEGVSAEVHAMGRAGGVTAETEDGQLDGGGISFDRTLTYGSGPVQLRVLAEVGLGHIDVRTDSTTSTPRLSMQKG